MADGNLEELAGTVSSPFETVDKQMPDRTISTEKRLVHDQRTVNCGTSKFWHPPALQPTHSQIAQWVLWMKCRCPGLPILLAKKDIAGAFRLLWLRPDDVGLFAGDLPWQPERAFEEPYGGETPCGGDITVLYLVSSFGFSGSPGEWSMWGRATEELHRAHRPLDARRDMSTGFDAKVLVDDCILVEPWVGLRPWVSAEVFEKGVVQLLGNKANHSDGGFDHGAKSLTLKQLQQFRGIMTGWAAIIGGLANELKAADKFLAGRDGSARIKPNYKGDGSRAWEEKTAWEDLWELFEVCRWLGARSERWDDIFTTSMRSMLAPMDRLVLPGEWDAVVFVSSDATPTIMGAVDWKNRTTFRECVEDIQPWVMRALTDEEQNEGEGNLVIHLSEMLSFVAFACAMGPRWQGKVVIYGGDNMVVRNWLKGRNSRVRGGRILIRVVNFVEMRWGCRILAGWWRTYHNVDADFVTRCTRDEFEQFAAKKELEVVDVKAAVFQALEDSEKFGITFMHQADEEDREKRGWAAYVMEYVTTEHGEAMARRRKCMIVFFKGKSIDGCEGYFVKSCYPVAMQSILGAKDWSNDAWARPETLIMESGIPRERMLPNPVGHYYWEEGGDRHTCHGMVGPALWPKWSEETKGVNDLCVHDRRGPPGYLRKLDAEEIWLLQGRQRYEFQSLETDIGARRAAEEGSRATGGQTAANLMAGAGALVGKIIEMEAGRAGASPDQAGADALAQILIWLRRWRRGEFGRACDGRRAGGTGDAVQVYRWVEAWWIGMLEAEDSEDEGDRKAGGRRKTTQEMAESIAKKVVDGLGLQVRPFSGEVGERVEEWLEENMTGDKSAATERAYAHGRNGALGRGGKDSSRSTSTSRRRSSAGKTNCWRMWATLDGWDAP